ncbi:TIGR02281 family clan AA aspartic protease [Hoeflea poritis]|uniref:TIGR02281 family clan AA aspartic protease n=1 Tax=Hoeflea poritis TaxID=2993659 RepID=A0ABT4VTB1_9HYPH|nr:TIGR02281 family clan AA aspartic protease [Hoeflea poritis]MDA4847953.1 TIGR02281 family clan AA aspartic protease [Hoeflea poritis]
MMRIFLLAGIVSGVAIAVPKIVDGQLTLPSPQKQETATVTEAAAMEPEAAYVGGRDVVLTADSRGHFHGDFRINGRSVAGLIDTGATAIAINRSTARKVGVFVSPAMFKYRVMTANGAVKAARVELGSVELKSIRIRNVEAYVLDDDSLAGTLIGMSFLNRLSSYRARDGKLVLTR